MKDDLYVARLNGNDRLTYKFIMVSIGFLRLYHN